MNEDFNMASTEVNEVIASVNTEVAAVAASIAKVVSPAGGCVLPLPLIAMSRFKSKVATTPETVEMTWPEFIEWVESREPCPKDWAPMVKLATFEGTRSAKNLRLVTGIEGDYDKEVVTPAEGLRRLEAAGIRAMVVTSHSHRAEAPRWRVFCPLSRAYQPDDRKKLVDRLNGALGGILARESWTPAQAYFVGRPVEGEYLHGVTFGEPAGGDYIDNLVELDAGAIGTPPSEKELAAAAKAAAGAGPAAKAKQKAPKVVEVATEVDAATLADLRSALAALDASDYTTWCDVGHALKVLQGQDQGRGLWLEWSASYPRFNEAEALAKWETFDPSGTNHKRVFVLATAAGWINPGRGAVSVAVEEFNEQHAVVLVSGTAVVVRISESELGGAGVDFLKVPSFKSFYENKLIEVDVVAPDGEKTKKWRKFADVWMGHPARRTHDGITFAPDNRAPASYFNLWQGFAVTAYKGHNPEAKCAKFLDHLRRNICRNDDESYRYLLAWLADMYQRPGKKPGVACVIRGNKGTGKSKLAEMLRKILGSHAIKVSTTRHVVGNFNKHLADKLLIVAEEAFFAGNKADGDALKDLITDETITMEAKGVDSVEVRSCHRILMLTNHQWSVPASIDERRYFVLDCGDENAQDHAFFAAIDDEMLRQGGLEAFFGLLMAFDLSAVNVRAAPATAALMVQKIHSLPGDEAFIHDALSSGEIMGKAWEAGVVLVKKELHEAYLVFMRSHRRHDTPKTHSQFCKVFFDATGEPSTCRPAEVSGISRPNCFALMPLEVARGGFEKFTGVPVTEPMPEVE